MHDIFEDKNGDDEERDTYDIEVVKTRNRVPRLRKKILTENLIKVISWLII